MGAVIPLFRPQPKARLWSVPTRSSILSRLHRQADRVRSERDWRGAGDLSMLAYLVRTAGDRTRSIRWRGIRFPLRHGLAIRSALCPDTGRALVGVMTL